MSSADWTPSDDALLKTLCADDTLTWAQIGTKLRRTGSAASNRAHRLGFVSSDSKPRARWTAERIAEAKAMWDEGLSRNEIARRLNTGGHQITRLRRTHGWKPRALGGVRPLHHEYNRILKLLRSSRQPMSLTDLISGGDAVAARAQLERLVSDGLVERVSGARYSRMQRFAARVVVDR